MSQRPVICDRCRQPAVGNVLELHMACNGPGCAGRTLRVCPDCARAFAAWFRHVPELPGDIEPDRTPRT
jgi:hypothetical protein